MSDQHQLTLINSKEMVKRLAGHRWVVCMAEQSTHFSNVKFDGEEFQVYIRLVPEQPPDIHLTCLPSEMPTCALYDMKRDTTFFFQTEHNLRLFLWGKQLSQFIPMRTESEAKYNEGGIL
jgi:hypothetical protein